MPGLNKKGPGRPVGAKRQEHEVNRSARLAAAQLGLRLPRARLRRIPSRILKAWMRSAG